MSRNDQARVSAHVAVPQDVAFRIFTEDIDRWWRRGLPYRVAGKRRGFLHLEPRQGGKLYESFETAAGTKVFETGQITTWEPPGRLIFTWRSVTFIDGESTEVEVTFAARGASGEAGTLVTVTHRGWASVRADHPVRHGKADAEFLRGMGLWWGQLLTSLRELAAPPEEPDEDGA
jgi:uncharacterized protein YndB with AHSA1/START domain